MALDSLYTAVGFFEITPDDDPLPERPRAIYVGTEGTLVVKGAGSSDPITLVAVVGEMNISPTHIMAASTANDIVGYR